MDDLKKLMFELSDGESLLRTIIFLNSKHKHKFGEDNLEEGCLKTI